MSSLQSSVHGRDLGQTDEWSVTFRFGVTWSYLAGHGSVEAAESIPARTSAFSTPAALAVADAPGLSTSGVSAGPISAGAVSASAAREEISSPRSGVQWGIVVPKMSRPAPQAAPSQWPQPESREDAEEIQAIPAAEVALESFERSIPGPQAFRWKPFLIAGAALSLAGAGAIALIPPKPAAHDRSLPAGPAVSARQSSPQGQPASATSSPVPDARPAPAVIPAAAVPSVPRVEAKPPSPEIAKSVDPTPVARASRKFTPPPAAAQSTAQSALIDAPPSLPSTPGASPVLALPAVTIPAVYPAPAAPTPATATPAPARESVPAVRQVTVASNLQAGNLIKKVPPAYPEFAKSTRIQGTVRFAAVIGRDGKIQNLKFVSGPSPLAQAAMDAVKQWAYKPTVLNGIPVEVLTQIDVNFTLSQ